MNFIARKPCYMMQYLLNIKTFIYLIRETIWWR